VGTSLLTAPNTASSTVTAGGIRKRTVPSQSLEFLAVCTARFVDKSDQLTVRQI